ncbi:hypothetical protein ABG768_012409 [Culter alburnus]|uniref:Uncharacterized protein n=1 Tax=Culter alburnus TaxID=194366 RepID=A0AAW1ZA74_CULAL
METEQGMRGPDMAQGLRRRMLGDDATEDRGRKCSKVQDSALRWIQSKEAVGEMDSGERVVGERVLEKVKSILWEDKGGGEKGSEGDEGGEWTEEMGKGKKCLGRKGSL